MSEVKLHSRIIAPNGGVIDFVSPDGEILGQMPLAAGVHFARDMLAIAPPNCVLQASEGVYIDTPSGFGRQRHALRHQTGANPDYQPSSSDRMQRQTRLMMAQMAAKQETLEKRLRALSAVEKMPDNPARKPVEADADAEKPKKGEPPAQEIDVVE